MAKILFITSRFPYPLNKGDKLRVYYQLKSLAEEHDVYLIAIEDKRISSGDWESVSVFCKEIHVFVLPLYKRIFQVLVSPFKGLPLQVAYFYNGKIDRKIQKIVEKIKPDFIHFHLIRTTEYIKSINTIPKSLDFMDAFGKGMEKRQKSERSYFKRLLFSYEKNRLYNYENKVFRFIQRFSIISNQDKESIRSQRSDMIKIIPNGVDFESFYPGNEEKKYDLVFMGNMGYPPNIAAVLFLVKEIIPIVKTKKANIKLLIAGIDAHKQIKLLQSENIHVVEDFVRISDAIAQSKIMVAPMQISIGLQNKILQAMAMKIPCIISKTSNNAIHAPNNKAILEANTPKEYADLIVELLGNDEKAAAIGQAGFDFVKEHYSWSKQNELLKDLILSRN